MVNLQKAGGIAALFQAVAYIVGFSLLATALNPGDIESWGPGEKLSFVLEKKSIFQLLSILVYVVFGISLVVVAVALYDRLKAKTIGITEIATAFGLIWSALVIASGMVASVGLETLEALHAKDPGLAASAWVAIGAVQNGLGGGVEIVGGVWMLLLSSAALASRKFPKVLNYVGIVVGLAGVLTIVPSLADFGAVFGLGQIVWFVWVGVTMLRGAHS